MSANNWMECPKCKQEAETTQADVIEKVRAQYGKLPEQEYRHAMIKAGESVKLQKTFREDYEQGMDEEGEYSVSYSGHCGKCGFSHEYTFSQQVLPPSQ